jgi:hypothetical protein
MPTKTRLIERAYAAWLKYRPGHGPPPTFGASTVEVYDDRTYVFLRRGEQIVAVYRYVPATANTRDTLKPLERYWPGPYGRRRAATAA